MGGWDGDTEPVRGRGGDEAPAGTVDADSCPVVCLGRNAGIHYFFSPSGEERELPGRALYKRESLEELFEAQLGWLRTNFNSDSQGGYDVLQAARWLIQQSVRQGLFDTNMQRRGAGVWRQDDVLVVHCGDQVLIDGEWRRAGFREGEQVYPLRAKVRRPTWPAATMDQVQQLLSGLRLWNFRDSMGPDLVLGFIAQACLGAAPDWRTHMFVRAPRGSGKTWLTELVANATGARAPTNNTTAAAIYQGMTGEARALVIDEAEKSERDDRISHVIELVRNMSSKMGGNIGRGDAGGKNKTYTLSGSAFMAAILHPELRPQDRTRFIVLRLQALMTGEAAVGRSDQALAAIALARDLFPLLQARMIDHWRRFLDTVAVYRNAALRRGVDSRCADSMAAILSGRDVLLRDDAPTAAEADMDLDAVEHLLVRAGADAEDDGEYDQCLIHLLSSPISDWSSGERHTVGEKIQEAQLPNTGLQFINRALGRCGLRLVFTRDSSGALRIKGLLVANRHRGLDKIFEGTRWSGGAWIQALEDMPGAQKMRDPTNFAGSKSTRCLMIPGGALPPAEDEYQVTPPASDYGADPL